MSNVSIRHNNHRSGLTPLESGFFSPFFKQFDSLFNWAGDLFKPPCDIEEKENQYLITFDVPGLKKEDLNIELSGNVLTVSGERKSERKKDDKGSFYHERRYGRFERSFSLPEGIATDEVHADYEDGILKLTVPKGALSDPKKKIEIASPSKTEDKNQQKNVQKH